MREREMGKVFSCIILMCKKERVTHVFNIKGWFYDVLVRFKISECIMQGTERERVDDILNNENYLRETEKWADADSDDVM